MSSRDKNNESIFRKLSVGGMVVVGVVMHCIGSGMFAVRWDKPLS